MDFALHSEFDTWKKVLEAKKHYEESSKSLVTSTKEWFTVESFSRARRAPKENHKVMGIVHHSLTKWIVQ